MNTLTQKRILASETYTIEYNGVRILETGMNKKAEFLIPFENIPAGSFFRRSFRRDAIILCMFFGVLNFFIILGQINSSDFPQPQGIIVSLLMIVGPLSVLWYTRQEFVGFGLPGNGIIFHAMKPSRTAVTTFMEQLHQAKVSYLREVYLPEMRDIPAVEQLRRLIWLKEMGVISASEFTEQKQALGETSVGTTGIGFGHK